MSPFTTTSIPAPPAALSASAPTSAAICFTLVQMRKPRPDGSSGSS